MIGLLDRSVPTEARRRIRAASRPPTIAHPGLQCATGLGGGGLDVWPIEHVGICGGLRSSIAAPRFPGLPVRTEIAALLVPALSAVHASFGAFACSIVAAIRIVDLRSILVARRDISLRLAMVHLGIGISFAYV